MKLIYKGRQSPLRRTLLTLLSLCVLFSGLMPGVPGVAQAQDAPMIVHLSAWPNPVQVGAGTEIIMDLIGEGVVELSIVAQGGGAALRTFPKRRYPSLRNTVAWDGKNAHGAAIGEGYYEVVAALEHNGRVTTTRGTHPLQIKGQGAAPAPAAHATATPAPAASAFKLTRQLVIDSYREVFNRAPAEAEIAFWLAQPGTDPRTQSYAALVAWHREFLRQQASTPPVDIRPPTVYREAPAQTGTSVCRDPWITQGIHEVLGRAPRGRDDLDECNITNYNRGTWASYDDLVAYVGLAFRKEGYCKDPWINHAIKQVLGRLPAGQDESGECRITRYGGGSWSSYDDLVAKVRAAFGVGANNRTLLQAPAAAPVPAPAATRANKAGPFVSNQGGLCMDTIAAEPGRAVNSKTVGAFTCHGAENQQFDFDPVTGLIRQAGRCLTAAAGTAGAQPGAAGDPVEMADCFGDPHYVWRIDPLGRMWGINNRCIGVGANSRLVLQDCDGVRGNFTSTMPGDHQRWEFRPVYRGIISAFETGWRQEARCLDKQAWGPNVPIIAFDCHGGDSQQYWVLHDGTIRSEPVNYCLDGRNGHGGALLVMDCDGSTAQKWYTNNLPGLFHTSDHKEPGQQGGQIQNQSNGLCIDIKGASVDDNAPVILWDCQVPAEWYSARPWNQMFGIGQFMASGRAIVLQRDSQPYGVGHSAWAIELEDGRWLAGAWDGITAVAIVDQGGGLGSITKGSPNGHWKMVFNTKEDVLMWFRRVLAKDGNPAVPVEKFPSWQDKFMPYAGYERYKEITLTNVNTAAAFSVEAQSWGWGYGVFSNNCMDVTFKLLKAYGVADLPGPTGDFGDYVRFIGGTAAATALGGPWGGAGAALMLFPEEWVPRWWFEQIPHEAHWL